jgi:hypothetical protein
MSTPKLFITSLAFLFLFSLSLTSIADSAVRHAGMITYVKGNVEIIKRGKGKVLRARVGKQVFVGDIIKTHTSSTARLTLRDGSRVYVAEDSTMRVTKFTMQRKSEQRSAILNLFRGKVRVVAARLMKLTADGKKRPWRSSRFSVKTPTAVVGVKGTSFAVFVDPVTKVTKVICLEGLVSVGAIDARTNRLKAAGVVIVEADEMTDVKPDSLPTKPVEVDPALVEQILRETKADDTKDDSNDDSTKDDSSDDSTKDDSSDDSTNDDSSDDSTKDDSSDDSTKDDTNNDSTKDSTNDSTTTTTTTTTTTSSGGGGTSCGSEPC